MPGTKPCPYCAEDVRAEAIKCRHCGSFLGGRRSSARDWYRSSSDRMIAGVCGGLAEQFGLPSAVLRLAFVLMVVMGIGTGILIYIVLWIVMPSEDAPRSGKDSYLSSELHDDL